MSASSISQLPKLSERVRNSMERAGAGAKVWAEVTELSRQPNIVADLGQGFPDFDGDSAALQACRDVLQPSDGDRVKARRHQYSLVQGSARLRGSLAAWLATSYPPSAAAGHFPRAVDADQELLVCTSGTEALYCAVMALLDAGDTALVFEPSFPWYAPQIGLAEARVASVRLDYPAFRLPDEQALRAVFERERPKLVIVNSPHNPSGHVASADELRTVGRLCLEFNCYCISDEVYEKYVFDGHCHQRLVDVVPELWPRTLTVGSASKLFSLTGWRVGWLYGPADLVAACRSIHGNASYCAPTPLQEAVAAALDQAAALPHGDPADVPPMRQRFVDNARKLAAALAATFGVTSSLPHGGYFLVCDVSPTGLTDTEFCSALAKDRGVIAIPLRVFYPSSDPPTNLVRFSICKTPELIDRAVAAMTRPI